MSAIADAAGIEGFVGGGPLVVGSTAPDPTTNGGNRVDGTPRPTRVREVGTSSPIGPGISVGEAVSSRLVGPLLVNGYVVIADGEMQLCQTLDQSQPPACGDPSLPLEGFEPDPGTLTEASGVAWTSNEVRCWVSGLVSGWSCLIPASPTSGQRAAASRLDGEELT